MRTVVSVTNDLVTDQRVHRSCLALHSAGHTVTLVGRRLPGSGDVSRPYSTVRMRLLFRKKAVFYAEYNIRLFLRLLFMRTDLIYANDTDTLPACYLAARLKGKPLFFDAHEMFPEVPELVGRERVKRVWTAIENRLFPRIASLKEMAAVTVCQSIADIYRERYGLEMKVVRNVPMSFPPDSEEAESILSRLPSDKYLLLYQGAVNIGRGIEWVMDAMPYLPECHLVVAGNGDILDWLKQRAVESALTDRVTFLGRVEPRVLHTLTKSAALGLSLLENRGLNYYYSLPNRIADFVQAGVPVLATDFPEIHRVVEGYGIGRLVPPATFHPEQGTSTPPDPERLAETIMETIKHFRHELSSQELEAIFSRAAAELSWENDKKTLLEQVDTIIGKK